MENLIQKKDVLMKKLKTSKFVKKISFTSIEAILIADFAYWIVILLLPQVSFSYEIYGNLSKIMTEPMLIHVMLAIFYGLLAGCLFGKKIVRMVALMSSFILWMVIGFSFIQQDYESMRGAVVILAVISAVQFVKLSRTEVAK